MVVKLEKDNRGRLKIRYAAGSIKTIRSMCTPKDFDKLYCYMDLREYPYINPVALYEYHKESIKDPNRLGYTPSTVYEKTNGMHFVRFKPNESVVVASLSITRGGRIFTMEDRKNLGAYARHFNQATKHIRDKILKGDGSMQEINPQHVGTHMPGFKVGGMHKHIVLPAPIGPFQIRDILRYLIEKKLIGGIPESSYGRGPQSGQPMREGNHKFFLEFIGKLLGPLREPTENVF